MQICQSYPTEFEAVLRASLDDEKRSSVISVMSVRHLKLQVYLTQLTVFLRHLLHHKKMAYIVVPQATNIFLRVTLHPADIANGVTASLSYYA